MNISTFNFLTYVFNLKELQIINILMKLKIMKSEYIFSTLKFEYIDNFHYIIYLYVIMNFNH